MDNKSSPAAEDVAGDGKEEGCKVAAEKGVADRGGRTNVAEDGGKEGHKVTAEEDVAERG